MCDAVLPAAWRPSAACPRVDGAEPARASNDLFDRILRRHRVDRETRTELQARDLAQTRVDLPVPVIRGVDLLAERRGVEDEVVRRAVEADGKRSKGLTQGLGARLHVTIGRPAEVGVVTARD